MCVSLPLKGHLKRKEQNDNVDTFFSQDDDEPEPEDESSEGAGQGRADNQNSILHYRV